MKVESVSRGFVSRVLPERRKWSHKGESGKLLVVGGSEKYTGAPALVGVAGYRAGCDLVFVAAPERAANAVAAQWPDIITIPLKGGMLSRKHVKEVLGVGEEASAAVIGNGLGRERESLKAVRVFLEKSRVPCVVDADAIYAVDEDVVRENVVVTPHAGEFRMICGKEVGENVEERVKAVKGCARSLGCTVLLKGAVDVVSDGKRVMANKTGNPYMSKGGTGDVLAGLCGGLVAMGVKPFEAACAAAWINGKAGEAAFRKHGPAMMASDVVGVLGEVVRKL